MHFNDLDAKKETVALFVHERTTVAFLSLFFFGNVRNVVEKKGAV